MDRRGLSTPEQVFDAAGFVADYMRRTGTRLERVVRPAC